MMIRRVLSVIVVIAAAPPVAALEVPPLERRVTDLAGLFTTAAVEGMERRLAALESDTGAQVAVLTIPGLQGQPLEDFSMRVVEAWQLGEAERDNGALVLIARDDRKIRIEVGYGLEGTLPDAVCGRIIDAAMTPAFRQGDFSGGAARAVEIIDGLVRGDPEASDRLAASGPTTGDAVPKLAAAVIFFGVMSVFVLSALFSKGGGAWFLYLFLVPFFFAFPGAILGGRLGLVIVAAWFVGFPILRILIWHTGAGRDFRTSHPKWTTWASSGGSWGGSSSGGFGGFSGGGGSFGGGGASGGW